MAINRRSLFAVIPAGLRYDKEVSSDAKLLYSEITALANEKGYCWAKNKYFARLYEVSEKTVSRWISQLKKRCYIKVYYKYHEDSKKIKSRRIAVPDPSCVITLQKEGKRSTQISVDKSVHTDLVGTDLSIPGGDKFVREEIIKDINNKTTAAAASEDPGNSAGGKGEDEKPEEAEAAELKNSEKGLKAELAAIDVRLVFDKSFYPRAADFMSRNGFDTGYLRWLYEHCVKKEPRDITAFYYSLFFAENLAEIYRRESRKRAPPPDVKIVCPVCGREHSRNGGKCPGCGISGTDIERPEAVLRQKYIHAMPEGSRKSYYAEMRATAAPGIPLEEGRRRRRAVREKYGVPEG